MLGLSYNLADFTNECTTSIHFYKSYVTFYFRYIKATNIWVHRWTYPLLEPGIPNNGNLHYKRNTAISGSLRSHVSHLEVPLPSHPPCSLLSHTQHLVLLWNKESTIFRIWSSTLPERTISLHINSCYYSEDANSSDGIRGALC